MKPKLEKFLKNLVWPVRKHFLTMKEIEKEKSEAYAKGCSETQRATKSTLDEMNKRLDDLTNSSLNRENTLRKSYDDKLEIIQNNQTEKCRNCMVTTEAQRDRLRKAQNAVLDMTEKLNHIFLRLFQHADLVIDAQDDILREAARIKTSKVVLLDIKEEYDNIMLKGQPLMSIDIAEHQMAHHLRIVDELEEKQKEDKKKSDDEKVQN